MLSIKNLHAGIHGKTILKGFNLQIAPGQVHAIMGPNGSGKSTLAKVLAGDPHYEITSGQVLFNGKDLLSLAPETRALEGLFLAFQYPVEIPGVNNAGFLRMAYNAKRKFAGLGEVDPVEFEDILRQRLGWVGMREDFLQRSVNHGFSGGEKKRNEIVQMAVLEPTLAILDETDSGLDIDALRIVSEGINRFRSPQRSFLLITHYQRLLNYVVPDFVHVLADGRLVRSGDRHLAQELESEGYEAIRND